MGASTLRVFRYVAVAASFDDVVPDMLVDNIGNSACNDPDSSQIREFRTVVCRDRVPCWTWISAQKV